MYRTLRAIVDSETKNLIDPMKTSEIYTVEMIPMCNDKPNIAESKWVSLNYLYKKFKDSKKQKDEPKAFEIHYLAHEFIVILDYSEEISQAKSR